MTTRKRRATIPRKRKDTMTEPESKPRPTMLDLAKKMDHAVRDADTKRQAADAAKAAADGAASDYAAAIDTVRDLHAQYDALMQEILRFGGTEPIPTP